MYKGFICDITVFTDLLFRWFTGKFWPSLTNANRLLYFAFGEFFSRRNRHLHTLVFFRNIVSAPKPLQHFLSKKMVSLSK